MKDDPLRIAVLGYGRMGEVHSEGYVALGSQVALHYVDLDMDKALAYADRFGGSGAFERTEDAIASPAIDAVDICLPDDQHANVAVAALEMGKHVLVEKPMAHCLDDAERMIHASQQAGRVLMVAENFRFLPHVHAALDLIDFGALGEIFLIEVNHFESLQPRGWRIEREGIAGTLSDVGHHFVDMAVQLGGPVRSVFARFSNATHPHMGGEDTAILMMDYVSGATGTLTLSIGAPGAPPKPTFIFCGTRASLYFDWQSGLWIGWGRAWEKPNLVLAKDPEPPDSFAYWGAAIHACVQDFVRSLREHRPSKVTGDDARHDLAVILAAHDSARSNTLVDVASATIHTMTY